MMVSCSGVPKTENREQLEMSKEQGVGSGEQLAVSAEVSQLEPVPEESAPAEDLAEDPTAESAPAITSESELPSRDVESRPKTIYTYDSQGNLTAEGTYTYDSQGNLTTIYTYDSQGNLTAKDTYTYDSQGNLTTKSTYDLLGNLTDQPVSPSEPASPQEPASPVEPVSVVMETLRPVEQAAKPSLPLPSPQEPSVPSASQKNETPVIAQEPPVDDYVQIIVAAAPPAPAAPPAAPAPAATPVRQVPSPRNEPVRPQGTSGGAVAQANAVPQQPNQTPSPPPVPEPEIKSPDVYLKEAREEFNAGRVASAITLLDQFRKYYPSGSDEAWWLYGQCYEANSPNRNILAALDYYRRIVREYPQSSRLSDARRRIAYLERYYINIQ
jgi:TolA-binding protein